MRTVFLALFLLTLAARLGLRWLNLTHLRRCGGIVPTGFEGTIDPQLLRRASAYTLAQSQVGLVETLVDSFLLLVFFFGGLLPLYDRWIGALTSSFIVGGLFFLLGLSLAQTVLGIPFSLYRTFRLEARFGFNLMTARLWWTDLFKSILLSSLLLSFLGAGTLWLIQASAQWWWLWVWGFSALVTLLLMDLSPTFIEPLFHKLQPLADGELRERIKELLAQAGLRVSAVLQIDASRRSRHSNAYFTGIGRVKRIVLYDTLLAQMLLPELLGILAHEAGHWRLGHIRQRLWWAELFSLTSCYFAFRLLQWGGLPELLGLPESSFFAQVAVLAFLSSLLAFPLTPLGSWWSRRQERQADRFAGRLSGEPQALAAALIKLSRENLSNLHPHPWYSFWYASHPSVVERVKYLLREEVRR